MNIEEFRRVFPGGNDNDLITVRRCDHPRCAGLDGPIKRVSVRRNILKHGGEKFICRTCFMRYDNPMKRVGQSRQTDELIDVVCPECERVRPMQKACYYGAMREPYLQTCGGCAQQGKVIPAEQREKISQALKGRPLSAQHRERIRKYLVAHPERWKGYLRPGGGWNRGKVTPPEVRRKQSLAHLGRKFTELHRRNISAGRTRMLVGQGGLLPETRAKISLATIHQYQSGFEPKLHHRRGTYHCRRLLKTFVYRSSYEAKALRLLEDDLAVRMFDYEVVAVEYMKPDSDIVSHYLVDFLVEMTDGSFRLIEVKPARWLEDATVQAKLNAGQARALEMGWEFEIWTENRLFKDEKEMREFAASLPR